jgi:hypothetical protein
MWELLLGASYQMNCTTNTQNFPTSKQVLNDKLCVNNTRVGKTSVSGNSDECAWKDYPCDSVLQYRANHHTRFNYKYIEKW